MALTAGSIEIKLFADLARLQSDMNKANKTVDAAMRNIDKSVNVAKKAFASITTSFGLAQVAKLADEYKKFDAQLQLSTKNLNDYTTAYENVIRIGRTAQSDIGAIGVLYARLNNNMRDLNVTQVQVANTTETISLALRTNNATVQETNSVMLQLSQSFGSGKLNGQEFLAVAEGAPLLLRQLAKSMGVPFGALKDLSAQGKLTREELLKAWNDPAYLESLRNQAKQVGTISSSITVLTNNLKQFIGEQDKASGASKLITSTIIFLADNINTLASVAIVALIASTGKWIGSIYASITASKLRQMELVKETVLMERKAAAETVASAVTQAAMANNARATTMWAARNSAAMTEAAAVSAAVAARTGVTATAMTGLKGIVGALGGPIGAITTALMLGVTAWMAWGDAGKISAEKAAGALSRVKDGLESINDAKLIKLRKAALELEKSKLSSPLSPIEQAGARSVYGSDEKANIARTAQLEDLNRQIKELDDALVKHNANQKENGTVVDALAPIYEKYAKANKILSVELEEQNQQIKDAKTLYDAHKISQADYNRLVDEAKKKINDLTGATKENKEATKEAAKHHKDLITQAIELAKQEKQAYDEFSKAQKKSREDAIGTNEDLQKEIDERTKAIEILMYGEDAYAQLEIVRLNDALATTEQTIAQAKLNGFSGDGIAYAEQYAEKLREQIRLKEILREKDAIQKTMEADKKKQAAEDKKDIKEQESAFKDLERAIDGFAKNAAQSMADWMTGTKVGFSDMINSMLKDILRLMIQKQITDPIGKAISGALDTGGGLSGIFGSIGGAFSGLFNGGVSMNTPTFDQYYNMSSMATGGARAAGGSVNPKHSYLVGERGPEMFVPQTAGSIVNGAGSPSVSVVINNNSSAQASANETVDSRGNRRIEVTVGDMVAGEIRRNGSGANQAIRNTFNSSPTLVGR